MNLIYVKNKNEKEGEIMAKNIEMNYKQNDGSYEVLYPKTLPELTGCLPLSGGTMTGNLILN